MRRIANRMILVFALLFTVSGAWAQFDYAEVVSTDSIQTPTLYWNIKSWLSASTDKVINLSPDSANSTIEGNFEFPVYTQSGVLKKLSGTVSYHFKAEIRESRYRYQFNDFVFHYMKMDRNYQMVKTGKRKSLKEPKASGWQKTWIKHRNTTDLHVRREIADLKRAATRKGGTEAIIIQTDW